MSDSPPKISVAIAGGGIGGLSLAVGLQKCPHLDAQVYEGAKAYVDIGSGLEIHGNGIRAMELIGEEVKRAYFETAELSAKDEEEELATDVLVGMGKMLTKPWHLWEQRKYVKVVRVRAIVNFDLREGRLWLDPIFSKDLRSSFRVIDSISASVWHVSRSERTRK